MINISKHWKITTIIIFGLSIVVFFGSNLFQNKSTDATLLTAKVVKTDLRIAFSIDGKLIFDTYNPGFLINGKVSQVLVKEGDQVVVGQTIARLDTQELNISLQQAQNTLRDKQAIVEKVEDEVKGHDADETFAQKAIRTTAQAARDSAVNVVDAAKRDFRDAIITSPVKGIVAQLNIKPGDVISTQNQTPVVSIVKPESLAFVAYAEEDDVLKITGDQTLNVALDAYNKVVFPSKISFISPLAVTDSNGLSSYKLIASIENTHNLKLIDGMEGSISFVTKEIKDVLAVSNKAIYSENAQTYVDLKDADGRKVKTAVITGFTDGKSVEIISGITAGQEVFLQN